jgi:hypothetical protein
MVSSVPAFEEVSAFVSGIIAQGECLPSRYIFVAPEEHTISLIEEVKQEILSRKNSSVLSPMGVRSLWVEYLSGLLASTTFSEVIEIEDDMAATSDVFTKNRIRQKREVLNWLSGWMTKKGAESRSSRGSSKKSKGYSDCSDDEEFSVADTVSDFDDSDVDFGAEGNKEIPNVYILLGKTGSGKSSLVYEVAKEVGAAVIEINTSQPRSGSALKKLVSEAGQSRNLHDNVSSCITIDVDPEERIDSRSKFSIILFDEIDVCFEDEDSGFYSSIIKLANSSRNPIVLTCEKLPDSLLGLSARISFLYHCSPEEFTVVYKDQFPQIPSVLFPDMAICTNGDLRAASSDLSLFSFRFGMNLPSLSSFSQWLFDRAFSFSIFDAISFSCGPRPASDNHSIDLFPPVIHSLFPRMISRNRVTEITVDGSNFLQTLTGTSENRENADLAQLFIRIGDFSQLRPVYSDNEVIAVVPKEMTAGYHEVYLELSFLVNGKVIKLSSNCSWILVVDDLSVEMSKFLFQQSNRSFGSIKAAESKVFDCARIFRKPPKSQLKKRRKSRLAIKRKPASLSSETGTDSDVLVDDNDDDDDSTDGNDLEEDNANTTYAPLAASLLSDEECEVPNDKGEKISLGQKDVRHIVDYNDDDEETIQPTIIKFGLTEEKEEERGGDLQENVPKLNEVPEKMIEVNAVPQDLGSLLVEAMDIRNKQSGLVSLSGWPDHEGGNDLQLLSESFDHLSSSDLFSRSISDLTAEYEQSEIMWREESVVYGSQALEAVNSYYLCTIRDVCESRNFCKSGTVDGTLDYRSVSFKQSFMLERYGKQFSRFEEYSGLLNKKEFFSELIPFFNSIGNSSVSYEEKENEFQSMLDLERKSARGRRLQSNSIEKAVQQVPKFQYLREITGDYFTEHELSSLLRLYSNLR